ncbi:MAG: spermidine/putrescine ABC transporter substrate-binding protein [Clostridia bacterium]|nr:spermidine/putrescine ABC transporter substrate-binding protein [Clostridia bacterium]
MINKIKSALFILLVIISAFSCFACNSGDENTESGKDKKYETVNLNVYNWGEYISDGSLGSLDTNKAFEEYFNENLADEYGFYVEVIYSTYATNEDMYSKITSGAGTYDVIVPSDYMIEKLIPANPDNGWLGLEPFDASTLSNYENIDEGFRNPYYDPEDLYSVPYTYGMIGVIYNTALVDPEDYENESWSLLWNEKYKGKILQFNNPRDAFGSAMYYLGLDINSTDKEVWNKALTKLSEQKPLVQGYVNDEIFNKMTTASAAIAPYFAGDFITMADQNEDLAFYYPKEGANYFVDAMCIPKNSKNKEVAKEYINFMLSEEPAVANALYVGYASPNKVVYESEYYAEEMGEDAIEILYSVSPDVINEKYNEMYGTACYKSFSPEIQAHVNMLWESLKTENATEPWVHITCGIIVAGVLSLAIYTVYIKKQRSRDYRLRDKELAKARKAKSQ